MKYWNRARLWVLVVASLLALGPTIADVGVSRADTPPTPEQQWVAAITEMVARDGGTMEQASIRLAALLSHLAAAERVSPPAPATTVAVAVTRYVHRVDAVDRWHDLAIQVGWPEQDWRKLSCIINRESGGQAGAHNGRDPQHGSFGLTQLNMTRNSIKWFRDRSAFWDINELYDPGVNLRAALIMRVELGWGPWKSSRSKC